MCTGDSSSFKNYLQESRSRACVSSTGAACGGSLLPMGGGGKTTPPPYAHGVAPYFQLYGTGQVSCELSISWLRSGRKSDRVHDKNSLTAKPLGMNSAAMCTSRPPVRDVHAVRRRKQDASRNALARRASATMLKSLILLVHCVSHVSSTLGMRCVTVMRSSFSVKSDSVWFPGGSPAVALLGADNSA